MKTNFFPQSLAANPNLLKQINYARLLDLLRCRAPISRADLARYTGLTRSTVTVITAELIEQGLVQESKVLATVGAGRPGVGLSLNPDGAFFIGAAIEVEQLTVVELNLAAQVVQQVQEAIAVDTTPECVLKQLSDLIARIRQGNPLSQQRLRGVGLAVQGTLSLDGVLIRSPYLNWHDVNLRHHLEPLINLPLFVDNDANAAALAEVYLGNAIQCHSLLCVLINRGVGVGIVTSNRVWRGAYGTAGEVGAILSSPDFSQSNRRKPQELNELVGRETLLTHYWAKGGEAADLDTLVEHLTQGNAIAHQVVQEWGQAVGWGLVSLVNIVNPERVVFGGPLTVLMPYVKDQLNTILRSGVPGNGSRGFFSDPNARFEISSFGKDAAAIGGAVLVYQSLFRVPDLVLLQG